MVISAFVGPLVSFGLTQSASGQVQEYNEERGPLTADSGFMIADPRGPYSYKPGNAVGANQPWGWFGNGAVIDVAPGTISTNAIALVTASPTAGTAITLSTANNSAVTIGVTLTPADGSSARTVIALDSTYATAPHGLTYGTGGTLKAWDSRTMLQRQITIARGASVDGTAETWTIQGYDKYCYKVTETITGTSSTGGSVFTSRKTYGYIQSITPGGTVTSTNVVIGINDTYGFPLAVHQPAYAEIWSGPSSGMNQLSAQSSLITLAATATATSTTADVRGTWASTIASNSTQAAPQRVYIKVQPADYDVQAMTTSFATTAPSQWLGVAQYSS